MVVEVVAERVQGEVAEGEVERGQVERVLWVWMVYKVRWASLGGGGGWQKLAFLVCSV